MKNFFIILLLIVLVILSFCLVPAIILLCIRTLIEENFEFNLKTCVSIIALMLIAKSMSFDEKITSK
jgi:hypothetical protein